MWRNLLSNRWRRSLFRVRRRTEDSFFQFLITLGDLLLLVLKQLLQLIDVTMNCVGLIGKLERQ